MEPPPVPCVPAGPDSHPASLHPCVIPAAALGSRHTGGERERVEAEPGAGWPHLWRGVGVSVRRAGTVLGSRYTFHWKNSPVLNAG